MKRLSLLLLIIVAFATPGYTAQAPVTYVQAEGANDLLQNFENTHSNFGDLFSQYATKWQAGTAYTINNTMVVHGGVLYLCKENHLAAVSTEPGVGASWQNGWKPADTVVVSGVVSGSDLILTLNTGETVTIDVSTLVGGGGLADAPSDGTTYGRLNGAWVAVSSGSTQLDSLIDVTGSGNADYQLYDDGDGTYSFRPAPPGAGLSQAEIEALANLNLSNVNVTLHSDNALDAEITTETLVANGDVGTSAGQLAAGDHNHTGVYEPADADIMKISEYANQAALEADLGWSFTGGSASPPTMQANDPTCASTTGWYLSRDGGVWYVNQGTEYWVDGVYSTTGCSSTYTFTWDIVGGNGTDYITYDSTNYTVDGSDSGLTADASFTVTPDTGRQGVVTGACIIGTGPYTANTDTEDCTATITFSDVSGATNFLLNANIVAAYYFENGATDETSNGRDLPAINTPAYVTSAPAPAQGTYSADLARSSQQYYRSSDAGFSITAAFSIVGYFYFDDTNNWYSLAGKRGNSGNLGWHLNRGPSGEIEVLISGDGTNFTSATSAISLVAAGSFTHIGLVSDGTNIRLYINGSEVTSGDFPQAYSSGVYATTADFFLGSQLGSNAMNGNVDAVAFFNDALSAAEVSSIYNNGLNGSGD